MIFLDQCKELRKEVFLLNLKLRFGETSPLIFPSWFFDDTSLSGINIPTNLSTFSQMQIFFFDYFSWWLAEGAIIHMIWPNLAVNKI